MSCMCGDLCCRSCGPAQGNYRCSACGKWSMDGGCIAPEKCAEENTAAVEAEAQSYAEMEGHENP